MGRVQAQGRPGDAPRPRVLRKQSSRRQQNATDMRESKCEAEQAKRQQSARRVEGQMKNRQQTRAQEIEERRLKHLKAFVGKRNPAVFPDETDIFEVFLGIVAHRVRRQQGGVVPDQAQPGETDQRQSNRPSWPAVSGKPNKRCKAAE